MTLYERWRKEGKPEGKNELFSVSSFTDGTKTYFVHTFKKTATRCTTLQCRENKTVFWERLFFFFGLRHRQSETLLFGCPSRRADETVIVLFKNRGTPQILGRDDYGILSPRRTPGSDGDVYLMTVSEFKEFRPNPEQ